jgi:anti-anti-sigma factor
VHLLKLSRPLVGHQAEELEQQFEHLHQQGARQLFIDLADVSFMDSRGLEALIRGLRLFGREGDCLRLLSPQTQPALLLNLTGFDRFIPIETADGVPLPIERPQPAKRRLRSQVAVAA